MVGCLVTGGGCGAEEGGPGPAVGEGRPGGLEASYMFDPTDKRELVGYSRNVFVGRVLRQTGNLSQKASDGETTIPESQFAVEVLENIKGRLRGTVTVSQFGGPVDVVVELEGNRRAKRREFELFAGDPLLKPGEVVLLATDYNRSRRYHTIVAQPFADRRIRSAMDRARLVREFNEAAREKRTR
jgi:hypothetical protein